MTHDIPSAKGSNRGMQRLTIKHLMFLLFGVALGITCSQKLERSHYEADAAVAKARAVPAREFEPMGLVGSVIGVGFGTGIGLAIVAITGGPGFWRDPARIGITILATMGILGFLVQLFATSYVAKTGQPLILQAHFFDFRDFVVHLSGFVIVCFFSPWIKVSWNWVFGWWCLALFALFGVVIHSFHFPVTHRSAPWLGELVSSHWHTAKLMQTGISVMGFAVAISVDLWSRKSVSWLIIVAAAGMIIVQVAMHFRDISRLFS